MKEIALSVFDEVSIQRRNRESVVKKLLEYLDGQTLTSGKAYVVNASDFLKDASDFHYYSVMKALRNRPELTCTFKLHDRYRASEIYIKVA